MMHRIQLLWHSRDDNTSSGFTIIEVMVAILIGLIVMATAMAVLATTNSASLRVLAKSEVQRNTRDSLIKVFDSASDAESGDICRVANSAEDQQKLTDSIDAGHIGQPAIATDKCKETSSSGIVLVWAAPNQMCYFKTEKTATGISEKAPYVTCITRGGDGRKKNFAVTPAVDIVIPGSGADATPTSGINMSDCVNHVITGSTPNEVYMYNCRGGDTGLDGSSPSSINWPIRYNAPAVAKDKPILISDLGSQFTTKDPTTNLFQYRSASANIADGTGVFGVATTGSTANKLNGIVSVQVTIRAKYRSRDSTDSIQEYFFDHTIMLRGSELAQQERANE